jgi:hypothetical protein
VATVNHLHLAGELHGHSVYELTVRPLGGGGVAVVAPSPWRHDARCAASHCAHSRLATQLTT